MTRLDNVGRSYSGATEIVRFGSVSFLYQRATCVLYGRAFSYFFQFWTSEFALPPKISETPCPNRNVLRASKNIGFGLAGPILWDRTVVWMAVKPLIKVKWQYGFWQIRNHIFLNNLINISQTQNIYQIDQKQLMVPDFLDFDHRFDGQSDFGSVS